MTRLRGYDGNIIEYKKNCIAEEINQVTSTRPRFWWILLKSDVKYFAYVRVCGLNDLERIWIVHPWLNSTVQNNRQVATVKKQLNY